jgi:FkbM family methyltransferase
MRRLRTAIQSVFAALGLSVTRLRPANRFDAMSESLCRLARVGFMPTIIIDAGANTGQWAEKASHAFPQVRLHLIEPQGACRPALLAFGSARGCAEIHSTAVTRPGCTSVRMSNATAGSTGAHVLSGAETGPDESWWPATTLDELFAHRVAAADRVLLKLDLEGHELAALEGARTLLPRVEVLVTETHFFHAEPGGAPTCSAVLTVLSQSGFELYDVAALASRPRDGRLRLGDLIFVRRGSVLLGDDRWV